MPDVHARLSPSAAERWLVCPASIRMEQSVVAPPAESHYAAEGTMAHTIAAIEAEREFRLINEGLYIAKARAWETDTPAEYHDDMDHYAEQYTTFLREQMAGMDVPSRIFLERRVDTGVPGSWGTADAILIDPNHVHVVDYKYGMGIPVDAEENPQLMLYALGALDTYGDVLGETRIVTMSVFQPRLDSVSRYTIEARKLREWRENYVKPIAEEALGEHARFNPTEEACRWCPAAGECRPRMMKFARMDFGDPDLMTMEELGEMLGKTKEIRDWCAAVEDTALDKIYSQDVDIPGWKVVRSGGRRSIVDQNTAFQALSEAGFDEDQISERKMKNLGDLERLVGKKTLPEVLGDSLAKGEGKPSLAPADDPREPITPNSGAQEDFSPTDGE